MKFLAIKYSKNLAILPILTIAIVVAFNGTTSAISLKGPCFFGNGECKTEDPISTSRNDVFYGRTIDNGVRILAGINNKFEFADFVIDRYNNPRGPQDKVGAAFIMSQINNNVDRTPSVNAQNKFKSLITQDSIKMNKLSQIVTQSSFYDNSKNDVFYTSVPYTPFKEVVYITQKNGNIEVPIIVFEVDCGNPVVFFEPPKEENIVSVSPNMKSSATTATAGQSVSFQSGRNINNFVSNVGNINYKVYKTVNGAQSDVSTGRNFPINSNGYRDLDAYTHVVQPTDTGDVCFYMLVAEGSLPSGVKMISGALNPAYACVTIRGGPPQPQVNRWLETNAQGGTTVTVEPEQGINTGRLWNSVTNTPQLNAKEWGYVEQSQQLGPYKVRESESGRSAYATASRPASFDYGAESNGPSCTVWIPDGVWNICTNWGPITYSCPNGDQLVGPTTCRHNYTEYFWVCDDDWGARGWSVNPPPCRSKYSTAPCQDGNNYEYWNTAGSARACSDTWLCQYADSPLFINRGQPLCEFRCSGGRGLVADRARLSSSLFVSGFETWDNGDADRRNCYRPWQVTLTCTYNYIGSNWYSRDPANGMPGTVNVTVNADSGQDLGNLCSKNISYYGGFVGDTACAEISTIVSGFETNNSNILSPNQRSISNGLNWSTRTNVAKATQCYQTIARPFVSFNKTDIRATGGYINAWGAWNGTSGYGTTVDYAIYATTWIDGVSSNKAAPSNTSPKSRTFANNDGSVWGGNFTSSMPSKYSQYVVTIGAGKSCTAIPSSITASQVINCAGTTATIGSNIDTGWTYASPKNLYIIADTINISGSVTSLNGVGLIARNINTCSDGVNNCASNLNITGFINSDSVRYGRAANTGGGSSFYCVRPGRPTDLPSWVARTCDRYTAASEIITYSPTFEISPAPYTPTNGPRSGKYDSIRALPPIY
jgi:hypothetical protein